MTKKTELPLFVVDGEYEDQEWRDAVSVKEPKRTKAQKKVAANPPRRHPYGSSAYRDVASDGTVRWFPDREAYDKFVNTNEAETEADKHNRPSATEGNELQAEASRKGNESAARVARRKTE